MKFRLDSQPGVRGFLHLKAENEAEQCQLDRLKKELDEKRLKFFTDRDYTPRPGNEEWVIVHLAAKQDSET